MNFGTVTQFFGFFGGSEWVSDHCGAGGCGMVRLIVGGYGRVREFAGAVGCGRLRVGADR